VNYISRWGVLPKETAAPLKPRGAIPWNRILNEVNTILKKAVNHGGNWLTYRNQAQEVVRWYLGALVEGKRFSYEGADYSSPKDFYNKNRLPELQLPMKVTFSAGAQPGRPEGLLVASPDFDKLILAHLKRGLPAYLVANWNWLEENTSLQFGAGELTPKAGARSLPPGPHAILIIGRMVDDNGAVNYRLENSWGLGRGDRGFFTVSLGSLVLVDPVIESRLGVRSP
jgi:hypothetical protein